MFEVKDWFELDEDEKGAVFPALLEALGLRVAVKQSSKGHKSVALLDKDGEEKGSFPL